MVFADGAPMDLGPRLWKDLDEYRYLCGGSTEAAVEVFAQERITSDRRAYYRYLELSYTDLSTMVRGDPISLKSGVSNEDSPLNIPWLFLFQGTTLRVYARQGRTVDGGSLVTLPEL